MIAAPKLATGRGDPRCSSMRPYVRRLRRLIGPVGGQPDMCAASRGTEARCRFRLDQANGGSHAPAFPSKEALTSAKSGYWQGPGGC